MSTSRWTVTYFLLESEHPDQQWTMTVCATGPIEAEDQLIAAYRFKTDPYVVRVEKRG